MPNLQRLLIVFSLLLGVAAIAETRNVVAVVDTGIVFNSTTNKYLCKLHHIDLTNTGITDRHGHGTNVAGLIAKSMNTKTHCLWIIKFWNTSQHTTDVEQGVMFKALYKTFGVFRPAVINMSFSGKDYLAFERLALVDLTEKGTKVVVAAGNNGKDLGQQCDRYPACYPVHKNFYVIGMFQPQVGGSNRRLGNYGGPVTHYVHGLNQTGFGLRMSGTSQAAANFSGFLIRSSVQ